MRENKINDKTTKKERKMKIETFDERRRIFWSVQVDYFWPDGAHASPTRPAGGYSFDQRELTFWNMCVDLVKCQGDLIDRDRPPVSFNSFCYHLSQTAGLWFRVCARAHIKYVLRRRKVGIENGSVIAVHNRITSALIEQTLSPAFWDDDDDDDDVLSLCKSHIIHEAVALVGYVWKIDYLFSQSVRCRPDIFNALWYATLRCGSKSRQSDQQHKIDLPRRHHSIKCVPAFRLCVDRQQISVGFDYYYRQNPYDLI